MSFQNALAIMMVIPLLLVTIGWVRLMLFHRQCSLTDGLIEGVEARSWLDDDAYETTRYFATIVFSVGDERFRVKDRRRHPEPPAIGSTVQVRYKIANPDDAMVELEQRKWWGLALIGICLGIEVVILRG